MKLLHEEKRSRPIHSHIACFIEVRVFLLRLHYIVTLESAFVYGNTMVLHKLYKYTFLENSLLRARRSSDMLSLGTAQAAAAPVMARRLGMDHELKYSEIGDELP